MADIDGNRAATHTGAAQARADLFLEAPSLPARLEDRPAPDVADQADVTMSARNPSYQTRAPTPHAAVLTPRVSATTGHTLPS